MPSSGFTLKVDSFIRYKLTSNDGKTVFDDIVTGTCTKTMDDAFVAGERMRLATAGAVRANISTLLLQLDSLHPEESGKSGWHSCCWPSRLWPAVRPGTWGKG